MTTDFFIGNGVAVNGDLIISGSTLSTAGFTGSLRGSASYSINALSASDSKNATWAMNASFADSAGTSNTSTLADNVYGTGDAQVSTLTTIGDINILPAYNSKINFDRTDVSSFGRLVFYTGGSEVYDFGLRGDSSISDSLVYSVFGAITLALTPSCNVGVKTDNPQHALDVNGNMRCNNMYGTASMANSASMKTTISGSTDSQKLAELIGICKRFGLVA